jgi:hypothetical protein
MQLSASDIAALYRPSRCENRILRRERGETEAEPSAFDEVLRRLGLRLLPSLRTSPSSGTGSRV